MSYKRIICVDFDGVIHSYSSGWKGVDTIPDPPVDGAFDWLTMLIIAPEFKPVIYSSRSKEDGGVEAMRSWFIKHDFKHLNDLEFPTQKPAAYLTVDDRAINFRGAFPTMPELMEFRTWNKGGHSDVGSNKTLAHARKEMELAGLFSGEDEEDRMMQKDINDQVLAMLSILSGAGHSGSSHAYTLGLFTRLAEKKNLTPLTNAPGEWEDRSVESGEPFWQNNRNSEAFSDDGGKTYHLLNERMGLMGCPKCDGGYGINATDVINDKEDVCGEHGLVYVIKREPSDETHVSKEALT